MINYFYALLLFVASLLPFAVAHVHGCNADNCLRAMRHTSVAASSFCSTYTQDLHTLTVGLPKFATACSLSTSRLSSACSCLQTKLTTSTRTASSSLLPTVSASITTTGSVPTFKPTVCPQTSPSVPLVYGTNSTIATLSNHTLSLYSSKDTIVLAVDIHDATVYIKLYDSSVSLFTSDGAGLTISPDGIFTFTAPHCAFSFTVNSTTFLHSTTQLHDRSFQLDIEPRQSDSGLLTFVVSFKDQCGNPDSNLGFRQLRCHATSSLATLPSIPLGDITFVREDFDSFNNNGDGSYTGSCPLYPYEEENAKVFADCHTTNVNLIGLCNNPDLNRLLLLVGTPSAVAYAVKLGGVPVSRFVGAAAIAAYLCTALNAIGNSVAKADAYLCPAQAFLIAATADFDGTLFPLGTYAPTQLPNAVSIATSISDVNAGPCSTTTTSSTTSSSTSSSCPATPTATTTASYVGYNQDNCSGFNGTGMSVYCCSGACIDGGYIGRSGECAHWLDLCLDLESGPPTCSSTQVLIPGSDGQSEESGDGCCSGGCECTWQRSTWTWSCCDCPTGYISTPNNACNPADGTIAQGPPSMPCVGCENGTLAGDATTGYYCIPSCGIDV